MNETRQQKQNQNTIEIDKKRVFIAVIVLVIVTGVGAVWVKEAIPKFLAEKKAEMQNPQQNSSGQVAGEQIDQQKEELQKQIEEIKVNITKLKPEDIKEQAPVQKILSDLDDLAKKASESAKVFDVKGNLCEEAKKRFCE